MPDFKNIKPNKIVRCGNEVKRSKYYDPSIELKPSIDRFRTAFNKLLKNEYLLSKDYKILFFYLKEVEDKYNFDKLYNLFSNRIHEFRAYRGFVRPFTSYIYNYYNTSDNIEKIYGLLKEVSPKLKESERYQTIKSLTKNNNNKNFLNDVKSQFNNVSNSEEIEEILKKVFMNRSDKFYLVCMVKFIVANHMNKNLMVEFRATINRMELDIKKEVFIGILQIYSNENNIDKYPDAWFDLILKHLGEPYAGGNSKWNGIEEKLKETFRRWNNSKHLYEFFNKTVDGGDQRRLDFWKQYIDCIYRIRYFNELDNALVMEFKNDVFVEFAKHGNALYIFDKKVQNIDNITRIVKSYSLTKPEKIKSIKDRDLADRLFHRGYWEYDFEQVLKRLNYNKGGW